MPPRGSAALSPEPSPDELGPQYLSGLTPDDRRRSGAFYTPVAIADGLVRITTAGRPLAPPARPTVCDPAMGGGAFLLAAARALEAAGHDRRTIVEELLWGADVDAGAVAVSRAALESWAAATGPQAVACHVRSGDTLVQGRGLWPDAPGAGFDLVVGNPPFLNQLGRATTRTRRQADRLAGRLGAAVPPYADSAALFLAEAVTWLAPRGRLALILPESVLAARDAGMARAAVHRHGRVVGFWWPGAKVFDALVDVCAPVVERDATDQAVTRWFGPGFDPVHPMVLGDDATTSWSRLLDRSTPAMGAAVGRLAGARRLGELVEATAGFRDQFYGVAPYVREHDVREHESVALVTVGLIDPLHLRWGAAATRFAGRRWRAPVVDLDRLRTADPALARWADDRLVPKVVLATQTRVLEPAVDLGGRWWPSVPAIAVTPRSGRTDDVWAVAAVLGAPATSAWALERYRGTALSRDTIKLAASQVLEVPCPSDHAAWSDGAQWARTAHQRAEQGDGEGWREALEALGRAMTEAYGSGGEVLAWWMARLPPWR